MSKNTEKAVKIVLNYKPNSGPKALERAGDALYDIADLAKKKRTRQLGITTLRRIVAEAPHRMRCQAVFWLKELASPETADLQPDLERSLTDPVSCLDAARGLYRILDTKAFPLLVNAIADTSVDNMTRIHLLDLLAFWSAQPWGKSMPVDLTGITERHFQHKRLKDWVADGCPMGNPIAEIPEAKLKRLKIELPADYREFLKTFRGGTPYRDRSGNEWSLTPASQLLTERVFGDSSEMRAASIQLTQQVAMKPEHADNKAKLNRLERGIVIGSRWVSGNECLLFLDATADFAVCTVDPPFDDIRRKAPNFSEWLRKVKPVPLNGSQNLDALAALTAAGGWIDVEDGWVPTLSLNGRPVTDSILSGLRKVPELNNLYWGNMDDPRINEATNVVGTLVFLDSLKLMRTPLNDEGLLRLKTLWDIKDIDVWQTKVTSRGVAQLQKELPGVEIVTKDPFAVSDSGDDSATYRCPVSRCTGCVDEIEDKDGDFWGCGECGSVWYRKANLLKEIDTIIKKYSYRKKCYRKVKGKWVPAAFEKIPDNYEELVENEPEDESDEYVRG